MKTIVLFVNLISGTLILWSYELYEVSIKLTESELIYIYIVISLILGLNVILFVKEKKEIIKYEMLFANLIANSYLGKIFVKIMYFEKLWYDIVYENSFLTVKRIYNKIDYNLAMNEYIGKKYQMSEFKDEIKNAIISQSKSMSEMFYRIDQYNLENTPIDLSIFYKTFYFCINHPILIITTITGIIGFLGLGYYSVDKLQGVVSTLVRTSTMQNENTIKSVEIDRRFNEAISMLQQQITAVDNKLTNTVETSIKLSDETINLLSRTEKLEKFFKLVIQKVLENNGANNTLVIEDIIKKLTENI